MCAYEHRYLYRYTAHAFAFLDDCMDASGGMKAEAHPNACECWLSRQGQWCLSITSGSQVSSLSIQVSLIMQIYILFSINGYLTVYLPIFLLAYLSIYLSISISLSLYLCIHLSIYLLVCMHVCLSLSVCLSVCLSICPSTSLL